MIKLTSLNKYYNRKKSNEIHVINDITLDLPEKGLVVLLGPSGSGKTTLLNVLGGLDKVQNGSIQFGDKNIERYSSRTWDEIRNKDVGYIFQNYNLLTNLTVYDNISLTLNMVGVVDKDEIDKRIDYILDNIGMLNFRKRRAYQLSGGQQQRVAIARALAKNPKVIIADEPTGNLDSKNTIDIMNIIKKISQTKLVVLVTHEEELADFYADRVIKLKDGRIVEDYLNKSSSDLDLKHDTDIYLKDLTQLSDIEDDIANVKIYSDEGTKPNIGIRLIVKNKTLYLDIDTEDFKKIKLIESDSEIKVLDRHFKKTTKDDFLESSFDLEDVINDDLTIDKRSVISIKESMKLALSRLASTSRIGKLFYAGFIGGAILIAIAIGMLSNVYNLEPSKFLSGAKETVVIEYDLDTYDEVMAHESNPSINYINLITSSNELAIRLPAVYQAREVNNTLTSNPVISDYLEDKDIILGANVTDYNEIVIDLVVAKNLLNQSSMQNLGITTLEDLLNVDIIVTLKGSNENYEYILDIVGISDTDNPVYYVKEETMYMIETLVPVYEAFADLITISEGVIPDELELLMMLDDPDNTIPMASRTYMQFAAIHHVSGMYTTDEDTIPDILIPLELVKEAYYGISYNEHVRGSDIYIHSNDIDATIKYFDSIELTSISLFEVEEDAYQLQRLAESVGTIIFTFVVLGAMSISYYFIIRSSLISRIYEVSVYRALGVTKGDIRKIFVTEIILITTITSLIGYLGTTILLYRVQLIAEEFFEFVHISIFSLVAGVILIYLINIISGILPVTNLLRRTPAEILSKYDF